MNSIKPICLSSKHKHILYSAYLSAKQELNSLELLHSSKVKPLSRDKIKSNILDNDSKTTSSPKEASFTQLPTIPKSSIPSPPLPNSKAKSLRPSTTQARSSNPPLPNSHIPKPEPIPALSHAPISRSLSRLESRLSRARSFQAAQEESEQASARDSLERLQHKLAQSSINQQKYLQSKRNSLIKLNKFSQIKSAKQSQDLNESGEKNLIEKILIRRKSAEIRKSLIAKEINDKIRERKIREQEGKEKNLKRIYEVKRNQELVNEVKEKNEKILRCRGKSRERLKSYAGFIAKKERFNAEKVKANIEDLKKRE